MRTFASTLILVALLTPVRGASALSDAGASTFESGKALYRRQRVRAEDIRVPPVKELPNLPQVPDAGPGDDALRFPIDSFEVTNNTLLPASRIDAVLAPFRGENKQIADIQAARDALQKAYDEDGLLSVAVTIPQQTVDGGQVRLDVIEARVGKVSVENEGRVWCSEESVRSATPSLQPGVLLRRDELEADIARANRSPDCRVRPTLKSGEEPGSVDVGLVVDDRIPLHGSVMVNNNHTPGSPDERMSTELRYGNLWGLGHELGVAYQFAPSRRFQDVQIVAGTYRAPMPWDADQSLFYYIVNSETENGVVTAPDLSVLGNGLNMGLRYRFELPAIQGIEGFDHALTFGIDRKDVENTVAAGAESITTPILYLPLNLEYGASAARDNTFTAAQLGFTFNRTGFLGGGDEEDFQENRGGVSDDNRVTGDFEVVSLGVQQVLRLPPLLQTLAAGRFLDLPEPTVSFADDWTFHVIARGQLGSEPLISTEQFAAGGMESVRGYLQSEQFGDSGWNTQFEVRTRPWRGFIGGRLGERVQLVAFYDMARLHTQQPGESQKRWSTLRGYGLGLRASLFENFTADLFVARPELSTPTTPGTPESVDGVDPTTRAEDTRYYFQLRAGF